MNNCTCGCNVPSLCGCNSNIISPIIAAGQISGELLGTDKIALIQNGLVIGTIPIITSGALDLLDAFGNPIPEN